MPVPKFRLGRVVVTPTILLITNEVELANLLYKHERGDFGLLGIEDIMLQDDALEREKQDPEMAERMLSVWLINEKRVYIITEADRSITTILLAEEY